MFSINVFSFSISAPLHLLKQSFVEQANEIPSCDCTCCGDTCTMGDLCCCSMMKPSLDPVKVVSIQNQNCEQDPFTLPIEKNINWLNDYIPSHLKTVWNSKYVVINVFWNEKVLSQIDLPVDTRPPVRYF